MNSMKRQKDRTPKDELPWSVGAQYATGDQWTNNSRQYEETEPKQKQHPVVDVTGDRSKVRCCKEQYCIGTWNIRSMNQGELEVVKRDGKEEKERYTHLNAEFQRIERRDKKACLIDQCKEIEENSRMGKTKDLFKVIKDTKGTFHAKMGTVKDRNGMDLTEAEDIKKRWQEYPGELYKKDLHDQDNQNSVITHLEPDILECES